MSISSRQSRTTSGLRRVITPTAPSAKTIAETARYQAMRHRVAASGAPPASAIVPRRPRRARPHARRAALIGGASSSILLAEPAPAAREHDARRRRRQQQEGGDLERRSRKLRQQQLADVRGRAEAVRGRARSRRRAVDRLQARAEQRDQQLDQQRAADDAPPRRRPEPIGRRRPAQALAERLALAADVGDDEHVEHHHRAGVDDDLRGRDELGAQQQEQHRERDQVRDEREHAVERVAQRDHADRAGDHADRGDEEEDGLSVARPADRRASRSFALVAQRRALERLGEQHLLGEDQVRAVVVGELVVVAHRDRVERAGDLAVAAEDAAATC